MNANDIFRKLSKGLKFSPAHNSILRKKEDKNKTVTLFKKEFENENINNIKFEIESNEETNITLDNEITLLNSLNTKPEKRGKKRKNESIEEIERKKKLLEIEQINHYRNINRITVVGKNVPEPAYTFDHFGVDKDIVENLKKCGFTEPTPIQKQAVPIMLKGQKILACAPTGSGKTAAFLVPIIHQLQQPQNKGFRAVILCPTRELAKQTQRECLKLCEGRNLKIHIMSKINRALEQYGPKTSNKYDILITTPKRLCYLLKQEPPAISLDNVEWLVIDEADKLFEEGDQGFRDQLKEVMAACTNTNCKIAMFSATCTPVLSKWCVRKVKPLIRVTVGHKNAASLTVDQKLLFVGGENGKLMGFRDLVRKGIPPPVLVFVQSKDRAKQLFNELVYDELHVGMIHADMTQKERDNTVKAFREGNIWVLICTELMARGIDFKGVNLVINYDFPPSAISYVHRIGRTGRADRKGSAITFFTTDDFVRLRSIAHILKESGCDVPEYMLSIKKTPKSKNKIAPKRDDILTFPVNNKLKRIRRRNSFQHKVKVTGDSDSTVPKITKESNGKSKISSNKMKTNVKKQKKTNEQN